MLYGHCVWGLLTDSAPWGVRGKACLRRCAVNASASRPTFLLVPGGHHGPWVWERLQQVLESDGWSTRAVSLVSAVEDPSAVEPLPGMHDDAKVIKRALEAIAGPVIVVAHSYGGVPVTEAIAGASNVVHAVYVAAYMLDVGEGMFQMHGVPAPDSLIGLRPPENPDLNLPAGFYDGDASNPETVEAMARLVPQTVRADFETVTQAGWKTVPNSYVIPDYDVSTVAAVEEDMAKRADAVYRVPGHHAPFYSHPREFADVLTKIATNTATVRPVQDA
ncbi:alpha/beta fold hydrolase [Actinacidiphila glaucinigra]|uniref:alpha/beta fold hydrolase n=1 Tax=Actinacidiphila glaucinigra TaxID=235986 RepID=UPI002DDA749E|nr:alpha/beta fold hydrolase [Actinacidiphila glaucinigra]WSD57488.1 alpha/beta fold hydrolase [Actinacidiphila glaucinigra]WSD65157.1 alpha/beta fold hydrolase [Actinacidiphila glaucinigra]